MDELNNDYLRHGKDYPNTVQAMVVWLSKRRGNGTSQVKEDDAADGVTSFAQFERVVCRHCQGSGHFNWDCPKATAKQRDRYREISEQRKFQRQQDDESSVGSNASSRSGDSRDSNGNSSNGSLGSASGNVRMNNGRRSSSPRRKPRRGVFELSNFAFGVEE